MYGLLKSNQAHAMKILLIIILITTTVFIAAIIFGSYSWSAGTRELRAKIDAARHPFATAAVDFRELESLPSPVRTYFRKALKDGQKMIAGAHMRHRGTFNMGEDIDNWTPFKSEQKVVTRRPGFDWDGRIVLFPGINVNVHDAYVAGTGTLHASVMGLFTIAELKGTREVAEGELMRFFAEAVWYPTALLPSQGVTWEGAGERAAYATLTEGPITIKMLFTFNAEGLIETTRVEARGRTIGDRIIPTPWQGRFFNYEEQGGMLVPSEGEVSWIMPEGPKSYWRGRITEITYEFAK